MMRFLPLNEGHTAEVVKMAAETGFFKDHEVVALEEVFDDYHAENHQYDHKAFILEDAGLNLGFVYFAPAPMTEGSWQLWWIVVRADLQGKGLGGRLLKFAEDFCKEKGGRVMFI
ncbi:MAG: GNAT family N-acetyltransferase, partial [Planctomycetia bacterium]